MSQKKRRIRWGRLIAFLFIVVLFISATTGAIFMIIRKTQSKSTPAAAPVVAKPTKSPKEIKEEKTELLLNEASQSSASFDYDSAITKLEEAAALSPNRTEILDEKAKCESAKQKLKPYSGEVAQVFFHELIVDPDIVFGPTNDDPGGHNSVMTTLKEFKKIIRQMYKRGYILISFHDLYDVEIDEQGKKTFKSKTLMLPKGKKPFIMSQDDVACYQKTRIAIGGYCSKYVLDSTGTVKTLYVDRKGKEHIGDYDLLPVLETFCRKHPDFSYHGARAYIGLTGFDGALGYRVNRENKNNPDFDEQCQELKKVADAAKLEGFQFASHSYAHGNQESESVKHMKSDTKKWLIEIGTWVGDVDTYILPKGNWWFKKSGWTLSGTETMARLNAIATNGFDFICGVGCDTYRVPYEQFIFMDRYNFDGYAMYHCKDKLSKFFNVNSVWDSKRPGAKGLL